jgi:hypothetical protein
MEEKEKSREGNRVTINVPRRNMGKKVIVKQFVISLEKIKK